MPLLPPCPAEQQRVHDVSLLQCCPCCHPAPQEQQVVHAVSLRCRDRDEAVRAEAFGLLTRLPPAALRAHLPLPAWLALLDLGLPAARAGAAAVPLTSTEEGAGGEGGGSKPAAGGAGRPAAAQAAGGKRSGAVAAAARELLGLFLFPGGVEVAEQQAQQLAQQQAGRARGSQGAQSGCHGPEPGHQHQLRSVAQQQLNDSWMDRLELLRRHIKDPAAPAEREGAYSSALRRLIPPVLLCRAAGR